MTDHVPQRTERMKAITQAAFGSADVLQLSEVPKPSPQSGEVLVRVCAGSLNPWDWHFMRGLPYISRLAGAGLRKPKNTVLGSDVAGEVEAVGAGVTQFNPGDSVFGFVGAGAFAEYVSVPESHLGFKPSNLTFEQAATIPLAGMTALQGLRDVGNIRAGENVLIIGASGGVGTIAVQIAESFGAIVTGVCSTRNVELVRSIGADHVLDYTQVDVTRTGATYDLIFQLAGMTSPGKFRRILTPSGRLILSSGDSTGRVIGPMDRMVEAALLSPFLSQNLRALTTKRSRPDLELLSGLIEDGKLTPVVERTYPLSASADAVRHLETGRVRGKLAISVRPAERTDRRTRHPSLIQEVTDDCGPRASAVALTGRQRPVPTLPELS
jgi:NADPH:quinone reductase-like Zn-dependent oxidoreductase